MPDLPPHLASWQVDTRVPDEVRALIDGICMIDPSETETLERAVAFIRGLVARADRIQLMIEDPPEGKHAIPTD